MGDPWNEDALSEDDDWGADSDESLDSDADDGFPDLEEPENGDDSWDDDSDS